MFGALCVKGISGFAGCGFFLTFSLEKYSSPIEKFSTECWKTKMRVIPAVTTSLNYH